ncbi:MAG: hypothetical protein DRJ37_05350 [Thermoprotei archaeon]|nr:MAG: hypothetical protein DRJ37_05350 [Thermoprotei archaeon]
MITYFLSFAASVVQVLYIPILSVYALEIGIKTHEIGFISGIAALTYALTAPFSHLSAGRIGEKWTITYSLALLSISCAFLMLVREIIGLALVAIFSLLAYAVFWPAIESLISREGGSVSAFATSWSSGALAGSLLTGPLIVAPKAPVFLTLSLFSGVLALISLKLRGERRVIDLPKIADLIRGLREIPDAWAWAFSYAVFQGALFTFYPVLIELRGLPEWYASLAFFLMIGARTFIFSFKNKLPQILHSLYTGLALLSSGILLPITHDPYIVAALSTLFGAGVGILYAESLSKAFSSRVEKRSAYTGLFESSIGLGYTAGPIVAGLTSVSCLEAAIPVATIISIIVSCIPWNRFIKATSAKNFYFRE